MKEFNLREELRTLKDKCGKQTQQHPVDVVLMITITIMRNIAMNVLRRENYISFRQAIRMLGGKIEKLVIS